MYLRTSCKVPGNSKGRDNLENETLFCLPSHKMKDNYTVGALLSMAQSLAIGKMEKRNGPMVHRASAGDLGQLFKNYQWTRAKEIGR